MKIINKTYEGAEGRRLLPVVRDDAGVSGDAFSTAIRFKLNSSYKNFSRYIEWEVVNPETEEKYFFPLINDEHLIPHIITSVSKGKTVMYNLVLRTKIEQGGFLVDYYEKSEPGAMYFATSNVTPASDPEYNIWFDMIESAIRDASFNGKRTLTFTRIGGESFEVDLRDKSPWVVENESELELLVDAIKGDLCVTEDGYVFVLLNDHEPSVPGTWFKINQTKWKDIGGDPTDNELLDNILTLITGRLSDLEDGKLDKVTEPTTNEQAYIKGELGEQGMRDVSIDVVPDAIVRRDDAGKIVVRPPEDDDEAVSKLYVDEIRDYLQQQVDGTITAVQEGPTGAVSYFLTLTFSDGSTLDVPLGMADEEVAGMITAPAYETIFSNESRISSLEGDNFLYIDYEDELTLGMSSGEVMSRFETLFPSAVLRNGNLFENNNQSASYRWREDTSEWFPTVATGAVQLATQSIPGIVKGSYDLGQGYIEADGTISFNGWDNIPDEIGTGISTTRGVSTYTITLSRISKTTGLPGLQSALLEAASSTWSGLMTPAQFSKLANLPLDTNAVLNLKADKDAEGRMTNPLEAVLSTTMTLQQAFEATPVGGVKTFWCINDRLVDSLGGVPFPQVSTWNTRNVLLIVSRDTTTGVFFQATLPPLSTEEYAPPSASMFCAVSGTTVTWRPWKPITNSIFTYNSAKTFLQVYTEMRNGRTPFWIRCPQSWVTDNTGRVPFPDGWIGETAWLSVFIVPITGTEGVLTAYSSSNSQVAGGRMATSHFNGAGTSGIVAWMEVSRGVPIQRNAPQTSTAQTLEDIFLTQPNSSFKTYDVQGWQLSAPALFRPNLASSERTGNPIQAIGANSTTTRFIVEIYKYNDNIGQAWARSYAVGTASVFQFVSYRNTRTPTGETVVQSGWTYWRNMGTGYVQLSDEDTTYARNIEVIFREMDSNSTAQLRVRNGQLDAGQGVSPISTAPRTVIAELFKYDTNQAVCTVRDSIGNTTASCARTSAGWQPWVTFLDSSKIIQNTGTSVSDIMSQNAVTTALNGKASTTHQATHTTGTDQIPLGNGTVKGLSINDYTTTEKNKLTGIETGAQVNKIEEIKVNGITQPIVGKSVDIATSSNSFPTIDTPLCTHSIGTPGIRRSLSADIYYNTPLVKYTMSCIEGIAGDSVTQIVMPGGMEIRSSSVLVGDKLYVFRSSASFYVEVVDTITNHTTVVIMPFVSNWGAYGSFALAGNKLFVGCEQGSMNGIAVINTDGAGDIATFIPMPYSGHWTSFAMKGNKLYVGGSSQRLYIAVVDINTNNVSTIQMPNSNFWNRFALIGSTLYVGTSVLATDVMAKINTDDNSVTPINIGLQMSGWVFAVVGENLYISSSTTTYISNIIWYTNPSTNTVSPITMPSVANWGAYTKAGNRLYVCPIRASSQIAMIDYTGRLSGVLHSVTPISMPSAGDWRAVAAGQKIYAIKEGSNTNSMAVIDVTTNTSTSLTLPATRGWGDMIRVGDKVYVGASSTSSDYIAVIDVTTDAITAITMPSSQRWGSGGTLYPEGSFTPAGNKLYVGTQSPSNSIAMIS